MGLTPGGYLEQEGFAALVEIEYDDGHIEKTRFGPYGSLPPAKAETTKFMRQRQVGDTARYWNGGPAYETSTIVRCERFFFVGETTWEHII